MGWVALIAATACWGGVIVLIKIATRSVAVPVVTSIEVVSAAVVVGIALVAATRRQPRRPPWLALLAGVIEPGVAYPLVNSGLDHTSGGHAAVILGTQAAVIVAIGAVLSRRWPPRQVMVASVLCVSGASVVSLSPTGAAGLDGDLLVAAGTIASAAYVPIAQRVADRLDAVTTTFWQLTAGAAVVLGWATVSTAFTDGVDVASASGTALAAAVAAGIVGSALAFGFYNFGISRVTTAEAGLSITLVPVFGVAASAVFLAGEQLTTITVIAGLVVVAGLILINISNGPTDNGAGVSADVGSDAHHISRRGRPERLCASGETTAAAGTTTEPTKSRKTCH